MEGIAVRPVRPGDGVGCALAWRDAGRLYATLMPEVIHEPAAEGLTGWFEELIAKECDEPDDGSLWLVAEVDGHEDGQDAGSTGSQDTGSTGGQDARSAGGQDACRRGGQVVGMVDATVAPARPDGRWQLQRALSQTRLLINALAVADGYRRRGVGTALLTAAEEWGRRRGATVAMTDTNLRSPLSVPFYEDRMGYLRQAVVLRKTLR
jgi:GNAT superfamily N-acetyltransferase